MKKSVIILFLLLGTLGYSQGYQAKISRFGSNNPTFTHIINVTYTAYNNSTVVDTYDFFSTQSNEGAAVVVLNSNSPITRITISYNVNQVEGGNFGDCNVTRDINITTPNCFTTFIDSCRDFDIEVFNTQNIINQPADNSICIDDPVSLRANNDCNGATYSWEYTTNISNPYQSLGVQSTGNSAVAVNLSSFLPNSFTGNVFIRAIVNGNFTNTVIYNVIGCTPNITSVTVNQTNCNYTNDGGFVLFFDEAFTNDQVQFELRRNSTTGPIEDSFSTTVNGSNYTWPNPLPVGTYFLRYQLLPTGSVVDYGPIVIASPSAVSFTATWTDVDCFGENTGSISINASGGVGGYEYRLNNGAWVPFSNTNSHLVSNLAAGNYSLRVRDTNGCTEQE